FAAQPVAAIAGRNARDTRPRPDDDDRARAGEQPVFAEIDGYFGWFSAVGAVGVAMKSPVPPSSEEACAFPKARQFAPLPPSSTRTFCVASEQNDLAPVPGEIGSRKTW